MRFSIVIALAPNRDAEIIESIKNLDYPKSEIQVIVVKGLNPSKNRNKGAEKAKGEIIGFLDDDATLESDFLKNVEDFFKNYPQVDVAGGPQLTPKNEQGFAKISGYALSSIFGAADVSNRYTQRKLNLNVDEKAVTSANLFVKQDVMNKVKFDTELWPGEDPKFIRDCKNAGLKVAYSPDFYIFHKRRADAKSLAKQIFNYGKVRPARQTFLQTMRKPAFLVPSTFLIYLVLFLVSIIAKPNIIANTIQTLQGTNNLANLSFLWAVPLLAYFILLIGFSVYESAKNKDMLGLLFLPFIYPIIHISYGTGIFWGYFKKLTGRQNYLSKL